MPLSTLTTKSKEFFEVLYFQELLSYIHNKPNPSSVTRMSSPVPTVRKAALGSNTSNRHIKSKQELEFKSIRVLSCSTGSTLHRATKPSAEDTDAHKHRALPREAHRFHNLFMLRETGFTGAWTTALLLEMALRQNW